MALHTVEALPASGGSLLWNTSHVSICRMSGNKFFVVYRQQTPSYTFGQILTYNGVDTPPTLGTARALVEQEDWGPLGVRVVPFGTDRVAVLYFTTTEILYQICSVSGDVITPNDSYSSLAATAVISYMGYQLLSSTVLRVARRTNTGSTWNLENWLFDLDNDTITIESPDTTLDLITANVHWGWSPTGVLGQWLEYHTVLLPSNTINIIDSSGEVVETEANIGYSPFSCMWDDGRYFSAASNGNTIYQYRDSSRLNDVVIQANNDKYFQSTSIAYRRGLALDDNHFMIIGYGESSNTNINIRQFRRLSDNFWEISPQSNVLGGLAIPRATGVALQPDPYVFYDSNTIMVWTIGSSGSYSLLVLHQPAE